LNQPLRVVLCPIMEQDHLLFRPAFSPQGHLHGVIEIPAGTNRKYEIDKETGQIRPDMRDGQQRMIHFLPYPLNYGFIPSTKMDPERGGDGDPLDILYLAESVPSGTVVEAIPIGLLLLKDLGEWDNKVLAIPVDPALRIISATNWVEFQLNFSAARHIIEQFFLNYDGPGVMTLHGWADEQAAIEEVKKWQI
jgi:inorganic pyrophosphatase